MNSYFDDTIYESPQELPAQYSEPYRYVPAKKKKKGNGALLIVFALVFSLVGSVLGAGGVLLVQQNFQEEDPEPETVKQEQVINLLEGQRESAVIETVALDTGKVLTPAEVYAANVNSTVGITTSITSANYWGYKTTSAASGSGFIISPDGYILTNFHVIEGSDSITVTTYSGQTYDAAVIGYDESNDIAVLKVDAADLVPVILGDSDNLNVGDSVIAIGNPLGELTFSLTSGAVSAMDREVTFSGNITMNLIQTDCAINSGNSGGALFNLYGEVIGVTNAKYSSSSLSEASIDNIGFAIPINSVRDIVESIIEKGYFAKPYIGLAVSNVSQDALMYGLPEGAAVYTVTENGPAAQAGLQQGDIITMLNGTEITGSTQFVELVEDTKIGDTLTLSVYRQGEILTVTVTVSEQIQSALPKKEGTQRPGYQGDYPGYRGKRN